MSTVATIFALICLVLPVLGRGLARRREVDPGISALRFWAPLGMASLVVSLGTMEHASGVWPMATVQGGLQTLALLVCSGWLVLRRSERMEAAGIILLSIVGMLVSASLVDPVQASSAGNLGLYISIHLSLIFVGLGAFALSFALSVLYLLQRSRLKSKQLEGIQDLPSLDTLDRLNARTQGIGFVALTVGVAMGFFMALDSESIRGLTGLTFWGTVSVWAWYAIGLQSRLMGGWRGRSAAIFGVVGFCALSVIIGLAAVWTGGWHGV